MMDKYREIQWIGRPGEAENAANYLADFLSLEGKYVQAYKSFGFEKSDAWEVAYNRLNDTPIKRRAAVYRADIAVITEPALFVPTTPVLTIGENTIFIVGTTLTPEKVKEKLSIPGNTVYTITPPTGNGKENNETAKRFLFCLPFIVAVAQQLEYFSPAQLLPALQRWFSRIVEPETAKAASKQLDIIIPPLTEPPNM